MHTVDEAGSFIVSVMILRRNGLHYEAAPERPQSRRIGSLGARVSPNLRARGMSTPASSSNSVLSCQSVARCNGVPQLARARYEGEQQRALAELKL